MSADFTTILDVKGTQKECLEIMKVLCYYANDREKQYREKRDCWYLVGFFGTPEKKLKESWKSGKMSMTLGGPYGIMNGPLGDVVDLFERIADAAPACRFSGSISGWDAGGYDSMEAELKDGLLYLRSSYSEFGDDSEEYDEDEYDNETDEDESGEKAWDTVYDPKTKSYSQL